MTLIAVFGGTGFLYTAERELNNLVRAHSTPQKLAERARIILLAAAGLGVEETAHQLGIWRKTAGHWRRWCERGCVRQRGSSSERRAPLRCAGDVHAGGDLPDHGASLLPETLDVPISHWSQASWPDNRSPCIVKSIRTALSGGF